jgi:pectate lyase
MPRADVTIRIGSFTGQPAWVYPLGAGMAARSGGVTASGISNPIQVPVTGVSVDAEAGNVNAPNIPAFLGAEGYGTETAHGRGGTVIEVTNLFDSGTGSLRQALMTEEPRIIIFTVSGTITLNNPIVMGGEHSYCGVFGETAPGDGICLRAAENMTGDGNSELIRISPLHSSDSGLQPACHDVVFRHIRFRHGARNQNTIANNDGFNIYHGSYNIVVDHCSFTWTSDETIGIAAFSYISSDPFFEVHDVTFSHCIIAEGWRDHNTGVICGGGAEHSGDRLYNLSYIRNYSCHLNFRDILVQTGSGMSNKGIQCINNVHYDVASNHHSLGQDQYNNQKTYFDSINEVFIRSSREGSTGVAKLNLNRYYTLDGGYEWGMLAWPGDDPDNTTGNYTPLAFDKSKVRYDGPVHPQNRIIPDFPQDPGVWLPVSLYASGNIQREVGLGDTTPSSAAAEADNELWVVKQYVNSSSRGGPYDGGETYEWRTSPLPDQPVNPVTTVGAIQAYTNLILNRDVGAKPEDEICTRQINAVQNGTIYDPWVVPGWSYTRPDDERAWQFSWPTLNTESYYQKDPAKPVGDTSGNGLPDYYQVNVLGKNVNDAYNPAATYTLGNGYSDLENWIWSLTA